MQSSIVSYPERGFGGNSRYRGNASGSLYRDLFGMLRPDSVCDPMEGSGTAGDVARSMGITYYGFDLHAGFNALRDRLVDRLPNPVGLVTTHPAYHDIIRYTGEDWVRQVRPDSPWSSTPHPDDLSRCASYEEFIEKLHMALLNFHEAVRPGGTLAVLIGDIRKKGAYYSPQADIVKMGLGALKGIIIKAQHNCVSSRTSYTGSFVPIAHEYLLLFEKERGLTIGDLAIRRAQAQSREFFGSWRNVLTVGLRACGGRASLKQLYAWVGESVLAETNRNIEAKVRQTLARYFHRLPTNEWALSEEECALAAA